MPPPSENDSLSEVFGEVDPRGGGAPADSGTAPAPATTGEGAPAPEAAAATPPAASATPAHDEDAVEAAIRSGGKQIPLEVARAERRKRQDMERELAEARGQLSVYQANKRTEPNAAPSDPSLDFLADPARAVDERVSKVREEFEARLMQMSAEQMRASHTDYEEAATAFVAAAQANPALESACKASANPALFAYQHGKTVLEVKKYGGTVDGMREAIRKEEEAKAEAKYRKQGALDAAAQASTSTAGARSVGTAPTFTGHTPLKELFPGTL